MINLENYSETSRIFTELNVFFLEHQPNLMTPKEYMLERFERHFGKSLFEILVTFENEDSFLLRKFKFNEFGHFEFFKAESDIYRQMMYDAVGFKPEVPAAEKCFLDL